MNFDFQLKIYQEVIDDVISGVREYFLESGVDEHVLQDLKQSWESKLLASKAVSSTKTEGGKPVIQNYYFLYELFCVAVFRKVGEANGTGVLQKQPQQVAKQVVGQVPPNNHVQTPVPNQVVENKMVPIQITLPAQPGSDLGQRVLSIQVPASALQGNQLHKVLTGPVISATMGLPQPIANNLLQQHVNAALGGASHSLTLGQQVVTKPVIQGDAALNVDSSDEDVEMPNFTIEQPECSTAKPSCSKSKRRRQPKVVICLKQHDGGNDTSDEDEDGSDDEDDSEDAEDDRDEDEQEMEDTGPEEEPLNSEDDVTDEDPTDLFDTENVVVCQYDKVLPQFTLLFLIGLIIFVYRLVEQETSGSFI